ncbi:hypothetical protein AVEN_111170-2-1, partial [Araneus ventricosus]
LWNGSLAEDEICWQNFVMFCEDAPSTALFETFISSEEELKNACSIFQRFVECMSNSFKECGVESIEVLKQRYPKLRRLIDTTKEICQQDSELHRKYVENSVCLKELMEDITNEHHCLHYTIEAFDQIEHAYRNKNPEDDYYGPSYQLYRCLFPSLLLNCVTSKIIDKCGLEAKDTSLEIAVKLGRLENECIPSVRNDTVEQLEILASISEKENYVKELLQRS